MSRNRRGDAAGRSAQVVVQNSFIASILLGLGLSHSVIAAERVELGISVLPDPDSVIRASAIDDDADYIRSGIGLSPTNDLLQKRHVVDVAGNTHTVYQQRYNGVPVWGAQVASHDYPGSAVMRVTGVMVTGLDTPPTVSASAIGEVSEDDALSTGHRWLEVARNWFFGNTELPGVEWSFSNENIEQFWWLDETTGDIVLVYQVDFFADTEDGNPSRPFFLIDAETGEIIQQWEGLNTAEIGTGPGGNEKVGLYEYGTDYDNLDITQNGTTCTLLSDNVRTINNNHSTSRTITTPHSFTCPRNTYKTVNGAYSPANDAHFFGQLTFDMFREWYSTDVLNFQLQMKVHYGSNYENAFWNGSAMFFGDGRTRFYPLVDVNVSAHEIAHGFTDQNSDLVYRYESGGMNEAFSDIAGEAAEYYWKGEVDWLVGSDIWKGTGGLRYFENPSQDGRSINNYSSYYNGMDVHYSSGLFNRAYYLIANSDGWNPRTAFDPFVLANQSYWTTNSSFAEGACGVILAAADLGYEWGDVYTAFTNVGVVCTNLPLDTDEDGMRDTWEIENGLDPEDPADAATDLDGDGLNNLGEYNNDTDPNDPDSDDDTLSDGDEVNTHGTNPNNADTDGDDLPDAWEVANNEDATDPGNRDSDSDGDGFNTYIEYRMGTDPNDATSAPTWNDNYFESFEAELPANWQAAVSAPFSIDATWSREELTGSDGTWSLRSGSTPHNGNAVIDLTMLIHQSEFTFDYYRNTQSGDELHLWINGERVFISSSSDPRGWYQGPSFDLPEGINEIRFVYDKNSNGTTGCDCIRIDSIEFTLLDADTDGMRDSWELENGLDPTDPTDAGLDPDGDGLSNLEEFNNGTDPNDADTDDDTLSDGDEVNTHGTDPTDADSDNDRMPDGWEIRNGLNPLDASDANDDTDGDGITNYREYLLGSDPNDDTSVPALVGNYTESFEGELPRNWYHTLGGETEWRPSDTEASVGDRSLRNDPHLETGYTYRRISFIGNMNESKLRFDHKMQGYDSRDDFYVYVNGSTRLFRTYYHGSDWQTLDDVILPAGINQIDFYFRSYSGQGNELVWIDDFRITVLDADGDGMHDDWELENGFDPADPTDAAEDADTDGLTNLQEFLEGTDPRNADTDADGLSDGDEVNVHNTFPNDRDSDNDKMWDGWEVQYSLNPRSSSDANRNADGDPFTNLVEFLLESDPNDALSTPDYLGVYEESFEGTLPRAWFHRYGNDPEWLPSDSDATIGTQSLRSNPSTGSSSYTYRRISLQVYTKPSYLEFDHKMLGYDTSDDFYVWVDGSQRLFQTGSGNNEWTRATNIEMGEGLHTIEFYYRFYRGDATEAAWVDNLRIAPLDADEDGMRDRWEVEFGLDPEDPSDAAGDLDGDGLTNLEEFENGADPTSNDTDGDGLSDFDEVKVYSTRADDADTDSDSMVDGWEVSYGLNPLSPSDADIDSDGDGLSNRGEHRFGTSPADASSVAAYDDDYFESFENGVLPERWLPFVNSAGSWTPENLTAQDGSFSLRSDRIDFPESASVLLPIFVHESDLSFWFYRNTAQGDHLRVWVDNTLIYSTNGSEPRGWYRSPNLRIAAGYHEVRFEYREGSSGSSGCNCIRLDSVLFTNLDRDADGMLDSWEIEFGLDPTDSTDGAIDSDDDGLTNAEEYEYGTDPLDTDMDDDGASDGAEVRVYLTDPTDPDSDDDLMPDGWEIDYGLDPLYRSDATRDADNDGYRNVYEYRLGSIPNDPDSIPGFLGVYEESFEGDELPGFWYQPEALDDQWQFDSSTATDGDQSLRNVPFGNDTRRYRYHRVNMLVNVKESTLTLDHKLLGFDFRDEFRILDNGRTVLFVENRENRNWQSLPPYLLTEGIHELRFEYRTYYGGSNVFAWIDNLKIIPTDLDEDGMRDDWELEFGLDPSNPDDGASDLDGDGLSNLQEFEIGTDPTVTDSDADGMVDGVEWYFLRTNPAIFDSDGDGMGDAWESLNGLDPLVETDAEEDLDGDGVSNLAEHDLGTNPQDPDSKPEFDNNLFVSFEPGVLPDRFSTPDNSDAPWWIEDVTAQDGAHSLRSGRIGRNQKSITEFAVFVRESNFSFWHYRNSGSNDDLYVYLDDELIYRTYSYTSRSWYPSPEIVIPEGYHRLRFEYDTGNGSKQGCDCIRIDSLRFTSLDADSDGMPDSWELDNGFDPTDPADGAEDRDGDGLDNAGEYRNETDPDDPDMDDDGLTDGEELLTHGTSPILADTDADKMSDADEVAYGFDPNWRYDATTDADGDTYINWHETRLGSDPRDAGSTPPVTVRYSESFEGELGSEWFQPTGLPQEWHPDDTYASDGDYSLRSDPQTGSRWQYRYINLLINNVESTLNFDYLRRGTGSWDRLSVYANNRFVGTVDRDSDWVSRTDFPLPEGVTEVRFTFVSYSPSGVEHGSIDNVRIIPLDGDQDGMLDSWESANGLDPNNPADAGLDGDGDGLSNLGEFEAGTNPNAADSDGDGVSDSDELNNTNTNPLSSDSDGDSLSDGWESTHGLNPLDPADKWLDADNDGLPNTGEYKMGFDPNDAGSVPAPAADYSESFEAGTVPATWHQPVDADDGWRVYTTTARDGSWSLVNENIGNRELSAIELPVYVYDSDLNFWHYWNAQFGDPLRVLVNDEIVYETGNSTSRSWYPAPTIPLKPGYNEIRFEFEKDGSGSSGCDCVRIDSLSITRMDTDGDGMRDSWETTYGFDPTDASDGALDLDGDGLSNAGEYLNDTDPTVSDSDGDGASDGAEVNTYGSDPNLSDTDGDAMPDGWEISYGLNPTAAFDADFDSDADGFTNIAEFRLNSAPNDSGSTPAPLGEFFESFESELSNAWYQPDGLPPEWTIVADSASTGSRSLRSIPHPVGTGYTNRRINFMFYTTGGTLSLDYKLLGYDYQDDLDVYLDGRRIGFLTSTGNNIWQPVGAEEVEPGLHVLSLDFENYQGNGNEFAWIDSLRFVPTDNDGDGMPNSWETDYGLNPADPSDAAGDLDTDGLTNFEEYSLGTRPDIADTDGDGISDNDEFAVTGTDPIDFDTDDDGMNDGWERDNGLNPADADDRWLDPDNDTLPNIGEFRFGTDPSDATSIAAYSDDYTQSFEGIELPAGWSIPSDAQGGWRPGIVSATDGIWSLESSPIDDSERASVVLPLFIHESSLTFWLQKYAERYDQLYVYVNDEIVYSTDSVTPSRWILSPTIALQPGYNELRFDYRKSYRSVSGCDCIRIDDLRVVNLDTDLDFMLDSWELANGFDPTDGSDGTEDADGDGLLNVDEYRSGANPGVTDSDGDGVSDGDEVNTHGSDPLKVDSDDDEIPDGWEIQYGLDPNNPEDALEDIDADGLNALGEYRFNTDPTDYHSNKPWNDNYSTSFEQLESFEVGELPDDWSVPEDADGGWEITNVTAKDGEWSIVSDRVAPGETAAIELPILTHDSDIRFWYYRNAGSSDDLYVFLNGRQVFRSSRTDPRGWVQTPPIHLWGGYNLLRFEYRNATSTYGNQGCDCVRIDQIEISKQDQDWDGMRDSWELEYGFDPENLYDGDYDPDGDGLTNAEEYRNGTDPHKADTDRDGLLDGEEVNEAKTDPLDRDMDNDFLPDGWEVRTGLDPRVYNRDDDPDLDGYINLREYYFQSDPLDYLSTPEFIGHFVESFEDFTPTPAWSIFHDETPPWTVVDDPVAADGTKSLRTTPSDLDDNTIYKTVTFWFNTKPAFITVDRRLFGTDFYDDLYVRVDGETISFDTNDETRLWATSGPRFLTEGVHYLQIQFRTNYPDGDEYAWIDNIRIVPISADTPAPVLPDPAAGIDASDVGYTDTDFDGIDDQTELFLHRTDPEVEDTDGDGMPDAWEIQNGTWALSASDATDDLDLDGYDNQTEYRLGSDPNNPELIPPVLGSYSESFEGALPFAWYATAGSADWVQNSADSTDGDTSLATAVSSGSRSTMRLIVNVDDSTLSLDTKITGSQYGRMRMYIDGIEVSAVGSDFGDWIELEHQLLAGPHVIDITVENAWGQDVIGLIDNLQITPLQQ